MTTLLLDRQIAKETNVDFRVALVISLVGLGVTLVLALSGLDICLAG
jgi:hypothetical protein